MQVYGHVELNVLHHRADEVVWALEKKGLYPHFVLPFTFHSTKGLNGLSVGAFLVSSFLFRYIHG